MHFQKKGDPVKRASTLSQNLGQHSVFLIFDILIVKNAKLCLPGIRSWVRS